MFHLAQVNIAHGRAPLADPVMADFVGALDRINAHAEAAPGFVWRYQDESGSATETHAFDSPLIIVNLSVWDSVEALRNFTYRSDHLGPLQRRREWFVPVAGPHLAMWWIPAGHLPTIAEARARLEHLCRHGESPVAFTFRRPAERPTDPDADLVRALKARHGQVPAEGVSVGGRIFAARPASGDGDCGPLTRFAYRQEGDRIWATYEGGEVRHGVLAARADGGWLVMRYLHADASGTVKHGTCVTAVATLPDGSLRLHEQWRWDGSNRDQESILDQVGVTDC